MSAMVYRARRDESGSVVVDWFVADSLDDLSAKVAEGWVTSEAKAKDALGHAEQASEAEPPTEPPPTTSEPASEAKHRKSAKKK
jgi:hypothetical protein